MERLHSRIEEVIKYISPLLKLTNSHMVNYITHDLWESQIPFEIRREFECSNQNDILDLFWKAEESNPNGKYQNTRRFLSEAKQMSVNEEDGLTLGVSVMTNKFSHPAKSYYPLQYKEFMSSKKSHEVEIMSYFVANLFSLTNATHVIDVGGGKGYLSSILALEYNMKVLGLDSSTVKTSGAANRINKLKKVWVGTRRKLEASNLAQPGDAEQAQTNGDAENEIYKQQTEFVSPQTDLAEIASAAFPTDSEFRFGLVGLHTCGDLAPVCLKQFLKYPESMEFIVSVGCCHHLLNEDCDSPSGFPLSSFLRKRKFALGRNARMLSLQAQSRIQSSKTVPSESLFYRAILQKLIIDKLGQDNIPKGQVGRVAEKCEHFVDYVRKALQKLELDHIDVADEEAEQYYANYESLKPRLLAFFMLRVSLAPVLENIILLDRLLYLREQGIQHAYIVKMFDPVLSPRCYGIVALRDRNDIFSS